MSLQSSFFFKFWPQIFFNISRFHQVGTTFYWQSFRFSIQPKQFQGYYSCSNFSRHCTLMVQPINFKLYSSLPSISYLSVRCNARQVYFINKSDFRGNLGVIRSANDLQRVNSTVEICLYNIIILSQSISLRYKGPK